MRGGNPEAEGQGSSDQSSCVGKRAEEGEQTSRSAVNSEETQSSETMCGSDDDQILTFPDPPYQSRSNFFGSK